MKNIIYLILVIICVNLNISCNSRSGKRVRSNELLGITKNEYLPVTKVVDGDTFWADNGTPEGVKIRLIGIDAPESRKTFKKEVGFYGKESKDYLCKMIDHQNVKLVFDVDSLDQYGRTLAYVYLPNGIFINADLVKNGYAVIMTVPPNVKFADEFLKLQEEARDNSRGLWGIQIE